MIFVFRVTLFILFGMMEGSFEKKKIKLRDISTCLDGCLDSSFDIFCLLIGISGTSAGKVYACNSSLVWKKEGTILFVSDILLYRSQSISPHTFQVINSQTLEVIICRCLLLQCHRKSLFFF